MSGGVSQSSLAWAGEQVVLAHLRACKRLRMRALSLESQQNSPGSLSTSVPLPSAASKKPPDTTFLPLTPQSESWSSSSDSPSPPNTPPIPGTPPSKPSPTLDPHLALNPLTVPMSKKEVSHEAVDVTSTWPIASLAIPASPQPAPPPPPPLRRPSSSSQLHKAVAAWPVPSTPSTPYRSGLDVIAAPTPFAPNLA